MIEIISNILEEIWYLFREMSPFLLLGYGISGILYILLPSKLIYKHLGEKNYKSVIKASLLGIPLPLCSCGVIPVANYLKDKGASKGSVLSFLISTPTTGVDSILATYSLLGIIFAIIRPVIALFNGIIGGLLTLLLVKETSLNTKEKYKVKCCCCGHSKKEEDNQETKQEKECNQEPTCCSIDKKTKSNNNSLFYKLKLGLKYGFIDLVKDSGKWIIIGIIIGGLISYLIPDKNISNILEKREISYPLMIIIGLPMYVCATGSIPIAVSLLNKGFLPGAVLLFLILGPATNTTTLAFIWGKLGKKTLIIYIITLILSSLVFAFGLDYIWKVSNKELFHPSSIKFIPLWIKNISGIILIILFTITTFNLSNSQKENSQKEK